MNARFILISGLVFIILAVSLGAFGAHALKPMLSLQHLQTWKTATDYQFYHALGLIGLGIWADKDNFTRLTAIAGSFLIVGIILFSGSLYLLALTGFSKFGLVTPLGGVFFILGWLLWLVSVLKNKQA